MLFVYLPALFMSLVTQIEALKNCSTNLPSVNFMMYFIFFVINYSTNIQPYFEFANYFKDIFKLFSKVLIIKEKKTAANTQLAK
jgi:hypothetical protein